jgi:hypothetical protein
MLTKNDGTYINAIGIVKNSELVNNGNHIDLICLRAGNPAKMRTALIAQNDPGIDICST